MVILTNGLTDMADEGFLKVANSLIKRLKHQMKERAFVITYDRKSELSDLHLTLNKVFLNRTLLSTIRARKERVLYVPFPSKPIGAAIRIFVLSFAAKRGLSVLWVQKAPLNFFARCLLKFSRAEITALSSDSALYFQKMIGVIY